jgi:PAS domain S-box-containing protein
MSAIDSEPNRRILIVDDNSSIHEDFRKILSTPKNADTGMRESAAKFLGRAPKAVEAKNGFELVSAYQGQEAVSKVQEAKDAGRPFALAFMDVRMPPGWDGIETTSRLWEVDPTVQIVICTAYSDYSWEAMTARLPTSDRLVILKKPFDMTEVLQLAAALSTKWNLARQAQWRIEDLDRMVQARTAELRVANQNLREQERRLSTLMGNLPGMAYRCRPDAERTMEFLSEGCLRLTGYPSEALTRNPSSSYAALIHPEDRPNVEAEVNSALAASHQYQVTYRIRTASADERWIWDQGVGINSASGAPEAIEGFATDITEKRQLEMQANQAQRLEAVGQLAGGVAHHFNNLLTVILGHSELGQSALLAGDTPDPECFRAILAAGQRASELVRQLLGFSRRQMMLLTKIDLNQVVRELPVRLKTELRGGFRVESKLAPVLPPVEADGELIHRALATLVLNARDARPRDHLVTIITEQVHLDAEFAAKDNEAREGDFVCVSVSDNGWGIAPERLTRIFEPFLNIKAAGQGVGLSLATTYGILKQHGGWISAASQLGVGTTFKIFLPLAPESTTPSTEITD